MGEGPYIRVYVWVEGPHKASDGYRGPCTPATFAMLICMHMCVTGWPALDPTQPEPILVNRCHELLNVLRAGGLPPSSALREAADVTAGWPGDVLCAVSTPLPRPICQPTLSTPISGRRRIRAIASSLCSTPKP